MSPRDDAMPIPPLFEHADHAAPSVLTASGMLSIARQLKGLPIGIVPPVCVLDPDGDLHRHLMATGEIQQAECWACFHTRLDVCRIGELSFGIIPCAVGSSFSVLLAEQLFASGCEFLISLSSAGEITPLDEMPYFVLIERALRDEGTSYHYLPPSTYAAVDDRLLEHMLPALTGVGLPVHCAASWTTDAPFRETESTVERRRKAGIATVEMEAAALYAFATARQVPVLCLAQVTNRLACLDGDFDKGVAEGAEAALALIHAAICSWHGNARIRLGAKAAVDA